MYTVVAGNRKRGIGYRIYEGGNVLVRVGQRVLRQRVGNPPDGQLVETLEQAIELAESLPDSPDALEWYLGTTLTGIKSYCLFRAQMTVSYTGQRRSCPYTTNARTLSCGISTEPNADRSIKGG